VLEDPSLETYNNIGPCIYTFGPHGVFPLGAGLQCQLAGYVPGRFFHMLAANVVFLVPFYGASLRMLGYRSVDKKVFKATLDEGRSVGQYESYYYSTILFFKRLISS